MTHYLRLDGETIVDVEATKDDISSVVCVIPYSKLLLDEKERQSEVIVDFDQLQELRAECVKNRRQGKEDPLPKDLEILISSFL